jgi:hypothetical protein
LLSRGPARAPGASRSRAFTAWAGEHGWLTDDGEARGFAPFYVQLLNSEQRCLRALADHPVAVEPDDELGTYIADRHGGAMAEV